MLVGAAEDVASRSFAATTWRTRYGGARWRASVERGVLARVGGEQIDELVVRGFVEALERAASIAVGVPGRIGAATHIAGAMTSGFWRPSIVGP